MPWQTVSTTPLGKLQAWQRLPAHLPMTGLVLDRKNKFLPARSVQTPSNVTVSLLRCTVDNDIAAACGV